MLNKLNITHTEIQIYETDTVDSIKNMFKNYNPQLFKNDFNCA